MSDKKSTWAQLRDAAERANSKAKKIQGQATMIGREVVTTIEIAASSYAVGFVDQKYGAADKETGLKQHKTNGIPSSLLGGAALKGAGFFDVFGDYSRDAFACGSGAIAGWSNTAGRASAIRFDLKNAQKDKTETKPDKKVAV